MRSRTDRDIKLGQVDSRNVTDITVSIHSASTTYRYDGMNRKECTGTAFHINQCHKTCSKVLNEAKPISPDWLISQINAMDKSNPVQPFKAVTYIHRNHQYSTKKLLFIAKLNKSVDDRPTFTK